MMRVDHTALRAELESRYGVPLDSSETNTDEGQIVVLTPAGVPASRAFEVRTLVGWRSVTVEVEPGAYARELVLAMGDAPSEKRAAFEGFLREAVEKGAKVRLVVNDATFSSFGDDLWKEAWNRLSLSVEKCPFAVDAQEEPTARVLEWVNRTFGAVISIVPLVAENEQERMEGAVQEELAKRYEQDPISRALCIEIHGCCCKACGFNFSKIYGSPGEGYIEVHHLDMLGVGGGVEKSVNPTTDLVPLCANCHALAHRRTPPYTVEEIREMISAASHC